MSEFQGYSYDNPAGLGEFEVQIADASHPSPMLAHLYQGVIYQSLLRQFRGARSPAQISETANPKDPEMVAAQLQRMCEATGDVGDPQYVHVQIPAPLLNNDGKAWYVVGVGKSKYADGRPKEERDQPSSTEEKANLADIGDVFVQPFLIAERVIETQARGIGSALVYTMLERYPKDIPAVVYEFPEIDPRVIRVLKNLGFGESNDRRSVRFAGEDTLQVRYEGPAVGDVGEALEAKHPWLREREPSAKS